MFEKIMSRIAIGLKKRNIDYMIVGGQAVLVHGELRATRDIDITLAIDVDRLSDVIDLARKLGFTILIEKPEQFAKSTKVLPLADKSTGIRVDFIFSSSEFERKAITRVIAVKFGRTLVKFASAEDLVVLKMVAGRPRDIEDVKSVMIKKPDYDRKYIESWLRRFDKALDTSYLESFKSVIRQIK